MEKQNEQTLAKDKLEFVSSIITDKNGNILVFKRRDDLKLDPGKYDFCSGHMKNGEIPLQSMYRELREEIGLEPHKIKKVEKVIDIATPHKKFSNTVTHIYHVQINLQDEIDKMVKQVEEPEMCEVIRLQSIRELIDLLKDTDKFRTMYTKELENALNILQQKRNERKEESKKECEER